MPIYEYECKKCGRRFELRRHIKDSDNEIKCPECGESSPERVFSTFGMSSSDSGVSDTNFGST